MPGIAVDFLRRQLDEPSLATVPLSETPAASPSEHKSDGGIPEIGGSEAGFLALVIGLSVIFLGSCIGVFYLLRNYKHGGRTVRGKSGEVGVEAPPAEGFPRRRGTLFGFRSQNPKRAGWVRAPGEDEDDWDAADDTIGGTPYDPYDEPVKLERSAYSERNAPHGEFEVTVPNLEFTPRGAPQRRKDESSVSTVDLEAPGRGPQDEPFEPPARSTSPATIDSSFAHYATYIDHLENRQDGQTQHRQGSADSAQTAVTLPGGTKFKEDF